jgi:hypothetical protein
MLLLTLLIFPLRYNLSCRHVTASPQRRHAKDVTFTRCKILSHFLTCDVTPRALQDNVDYSDFNGTAFIKDCLVPLSDGGGKGQAAGRQLVMAVK